MIEYEYLQQKALMDWAALNVKKAPELRWLFAVPNGGQRSKAVAGKLKASGVKKGVMDLHLPVKRGEFSGLWVEMKYGKNKLTPEQVEFKDFVESQGFKVVECWDWEAAKAAIEGYLAIGMWQ